MKIDFRVPTVKDANMIVTWTYEDIYAFYNNDKTEAKKQWASNIHKEKNTFVLYDEEDNLIGNCCFDFDEDGVIFGIQMRPDLTGKGMGTDISRQVLEFGREKYNYQEILLYVAKFNQRAIRVYEKLGFNIIEEFIWDVNNEKKEFLTMKKVY